MNGVMFNGLHSYSDFSLILSHKELGVPQPKTELLEVPGVDGALDLTEFFGDTKFENRTHKFEFSTIARGDGFINLFSKVQNAVHGKRMKIVLDEDPGFYYLGRVSVKEWLADKGIGKIMIECNCDPYKLKKDKTIVTEVIGAEKVITLQNLRKWVVPTITTDAQTQVTFEGVHYSLAAGVHIVPGIVLKDGDNTLTCTGTGTIQFEYQEGAL